MTRTKFVAVEFYINNFGGARL